MTDKELIKQEIERRYNCEKCYPLDREANVAAAVLQELLLFIDSLPEESTSDEEIEALNDVRHLNSGLDSLYWKLKNHDTSKNCKSWNPSIEFCKTKNKKKISTSTCSVFKQLSHDREDTKRNQ